MDKVIKFIEDMKKQYGMNNDEVLQAIQDDSQHKFIMDTQNVTRAEASTIIIEAEEYLLSKKEA